MVRGLTALLVVLASTLALVYLSITTVRPVTAAFTHSDHHREPQAAATAHRRQLLHELPAGSHDQHTTNATASQQSHSSRLHRADRFGPNEANTLFGMVVVLIGLTVLFELGKQAIERHAGEEMEAIIAAMFGELTVLGFIGLLTFLVIRTGLGEKMSAEFLGPVTHVPGHHTVPPLVVMLEEMHMGLFGMMVVYILCVVAVIRHGKTNAQLWDSADQISREVGTCNSLSRSRTLRSRVPLTTYF